MKTQSKSGMGFLVKIFIGNLKNRSNLEYLRKSPWNSGSWKPPLEFDWFFHLLGNFHWEFKNPIKLGSKKTCWKFDWVFCDFRGNLFFFFVPRLLNADLTAVLKAAENFDWERISFVLEASPWSSIAASSCTLHFFFLGFVCVLLTPKYPKLSTPQIQVKKPLTDGNPLKKLS